MFTKRWGSFTGAPQLSSAFDLKATDLRKPDSVAAGPIKASSATIIPLTIFIAEDLWRSTREPAQAALRGSVFEAAQLLSYSILLRAEFGCFHSGSSPESSRFRFQAQCPGHSLCSTVPHLAVEGRYPLRCLLESGLSSRVAKATPAIACKSTP